MDLRRKTLTRNLTLFLSLINVLVLGCFGAVSYMVNVRQSHEALREKLEINAENLTDVLAIPLWNYDSPTIEFVGKAYVEAGSVDRLTVYTDLNEEIFSLGAERQPEDVTLSRRVTYQGEAVGLLEVALRSGRDEIRRQVLGFYGTAVGAIVILVVVFTVLIMNRGLQAPLARLREGIGKISEGQYDIRLRSDRHEDINDIITDINLMAAQIQERKELQEREIRKREAAEKNLQELNRELEARVEQRTAELRRVNQAQEESLNMLKEAQDMLVETEKMAALGSLVAGLAHEINTPVGISITAVSHLDHKLEELKEKYSSSAMKQSDFEGFLETASESTRMIDRNIHRAAELISSFKQVAVDQSRDDKRLFNMREYLDDILLSLKPELKKRNPRVVIDCPPDLEVYSMPGVFSQVITNFVMNALNHAFGEDAEDPELTITVSAGEEGMLLSFQDNGRGMDEETVKHVFEPFYTTKRGSGGTGLGLNIVYNLVSFRLKGQLRCSSKPGEGTSFILTCPLASSEEGSAGAGDAKASEAGAPGTGEA